ncbi:hypothetical protein GCM10009775_28010 [Microbacterium aoyamense]|uniref:Uncharacterized protein n=1 Tax=Microbacterium aoyamense TaxID=344166 RepID=A0ABN2PVU9_9MICO|nr:hypothetical protein [Microbacterium aoyamense]
MTDTTPTRSLKIFRRVIVAVIIVSFGLAALLGIIVLLGGNLGSEQYRALGTTATIGAFSVAVLCCAALAGRRLQIVGFIGAAVAVVTAILTVWLIWYRYESYPDHFYDALSRWTWTGVALTVALSFASLLLLLADRRQAAVRIGLVITVALFAVVLGMTIYAIWWSSTIEGDAFGRTLGVFAILAALGAVIVPVLSLLLRDPHPATGLSSVSVALLEAEAVRRGIPVDALVDDLLRESSPADPVDPR